MGDISGFGLEVLVVATSTFPVGFNVTEFSDDADAFSVEEMQQGDVAMGLNGDMVSWSTPNPIRVTISVIPDSDDDINLSLLAEANRTGKGKRAVLDQIFMTKTVPGAPGDVPLILTNGKMINSSIATSVQQGGRKQTKNYVFAFENKVGVS